MILKRKHIAHREWIDYCTQRKIYIREIIKKIWFWIKKDDSWAKFDKYFKDFEKEHFVIMSIIRRVRNLQKMIDDVMNHITERWKFNSAKIEIGSDISITKFEKRHLASNFIERYELSSSDRRSVWFRKNDDSRTAWF